MIIRLDKKSMLKMEKTKRNGHAVIARNSDEILQSRAVMPQSLFRDQKKNRDDLHNRLIERSLSMSYL
jgi:hypothetical protein